MDFKKKYDTRSEINSKKEKEVSWALVKIEETTRERLKKMAFMEKKEMQEIANKAIDEYLKEKEY